MYIQAIYASYNISYTTLKPITLRSDRLFCCRLHILTVIFKFDKIFLEKQEHSIYIFMSILFREHYSRKGSELKMDMKVHLPVATLPLDNGCEYYYFNSQFLPIFYRIPKEILEIRGKELMWIPRTPASAYYDAEVIRFVESDIFMKGIIDCVAYMIQKEVQILLSCLC